MEYEGRSNVPRMELEAGIMSQHPRPRTEFRLSWNSIVPTFETFVQTKEPIFLFDRSSLCVVVVIAPSDLYSVHIELERRKCLCDSPSNFFSWGLGMGIGLISDVC